jgi:hypothetical protein
VNSEGRATRIYQWLSSRASFFRSEASGQGASRTVRTEVTVEREGIALLVGGAAADFDNCPLCGQKLAMAQAQQARLRLLEDLISQGPGPVDLPHPEYPVAQPNKWMLADQGIAETETKSNTKIIKKNQNEN